MSMGRDLQTQVNYTHVFHPYPAKFPANIIRTYIEKYSKQGDSVIDPFCGSGTTLVECLLLDRNCLGMEINPVGVLMSKSKSAKYSEKDKEKLDSIIQELTNSLVEPKKWIKESYSDNLPKYENREYWFKDFVIIELNAIKSNIIDKYKNNDRLHELLLTAFSRIIVPVSNQDTETRYARIEKNLNIGDTIKLFLKTLKSYQKILADPYVVYNGSKINVIHGDSLKELPKIDENSFDLALTSPPYINSFDYYLYHKHRIFLLNENPRIVRKTEIGGHHTIDSQSYDKAFGNYYEAMKTTFTNLHRILKSNKKFILFIGDGVVKGRIIDALDVMTTIGKETGFKLLGNESVPLKEVSKVFIKDEKIEKKKHHIMTFNNSK